MFRIIKYLILLITAGVICTLVMFWYFLVLPADSASVDKNFIIAKGEGVNQISRNLYDQKLIKSMFYFETYVWLEKMQTKFLAGEYVLNTDMNIKQVTKVLTSGKVINKEKNIKIIEGWKISDIDKYLSEEAIIAKNGFLNLAQNKIADWQFKTAKPEFLNDLPASANLEGFLFPDTYRIFNDANVEDIIMKMLDNFDKKLTPAMRDNIRKQGKTIYEIITMASVVEKEVKKPDDMKIVSGIFWNRIKNGQPLQSCASLAYILGINKKQYTKADTEIISPYNTYKNQGLPPGPIANPGLNAINAAIYPTNTDYNYFLNRFDNGETIFSATYEEHLKNKNKFLQ
jgi:UPF0755 protein